MEENQLQLNSEAKHFMSEIGKWAYFLSIVGFVMVGLFVLIAIFAGSIFSMMGNTMGGAMGSAGIMGSVLTVVYLLCALIYFFPVYYLNRFAAKVKTAIHQNDSSVLTEALQYLKSHYKFLGILTIIALAFYSIVIIFSVIGFAGR
ncbi:MAG: hypothetical protein EOO48_00690 [Flavobacterium sp.]|nr:MAG: hypothetical protein EOO48_00690 [Flavobacterium sp.]